MEQLKDVIIEETLAGIGSSRYEEYLAHALCLGGNCSFTFNGSHFELKEGDLMIVRKGKLLDDVKPSEDFMVKTLYVTAPFIELCTPQTNYGMKGQLSLFLNPIMSLDERQQFRVRTRFPLDSLPPVADRPHLLSRTADKCGTVGHTRFL